MACLKFTLFVLLVGLLVTAPSYGQTLSTRSTLGEVHAREQVQQATKTSTQVPFPKPLLASKALAIATVEPLLLSRYGQAQIRQQRPYEAYLINGFWYIAGTLPKDTDGGTFEVIVEAQNGRVWQMTHSK